MLYAQELIEEIRLQNDIVDIISGYIPLKQKGSSYFGLCPFHHEKTPSFSVNSEKQFYYCFGCGAAGNVYSFVMQMENCDFMEAVKTLADKAHITLPEADFSNQNQHIQRQKQTLFEIHKMAGRFYYEKIHEDVGKFALQYLNNRKILPNIQKKFGIGYAPLGKDNLLQHLKEKGFEISDMLKSGLVMKNKNTQGYHDRFYNRLMFPIFDVQKQVVGFGGRIMENGEPKYLNSPETLLFNKSKILYGLNLAKSTKKEEIILVEGYMDMISIYQAGYHNVAASLGTAFNVEHARLLKRYVKSIILLYDSDEAGTNAILRAIPILVSNGFSVKVLQVPDGKDPDEFIKQNGSKAFGKLLLQAAHYILFQINCIKKKYNLQDIQQKVFFTIEAARILAQCPNDIEQDAYMKEVAKFTKINESAIKEEINKMKQKSDVAFAQEADKKRMQIFNKDVKDNFFSSSQGILKIQKDILYISATKGVIFHKIRNILKPDDYIEEIYKKLAKIIDDFYEKNIKIMPANLISCFEMAEEQKIVTEIFAQPLSYENNKDMEKAINENIRRIKETKIDNCIAQTFDMEEIKKLLEQKRKLKELYITILDG